MERKVSLFIYFVGFILPVLGMYNCSESGGEITSCIVDTAFLRNYAGFYYGLLLLSSFLLLVPLAVYALLVKVIASITSRTLNWIAVDKSSEGE